MVSDRREDRIDYVRREEETLPQSGQLPIEIGSSGLLAQVCSQVDWLWAPVDLLVRWGTIARSIIGRAVKHFTALSGTE